MRNLVLYLQAVGYSEKFLLIFIENNLKIENVYKYLQKKVSKYYFK